MDYANHRFTSLNSRVDRFRMQAEECRELADIARFPEAKRIYRDLAISYEQLANHAETIDTINGPSAGR